MANRRRVLCVRVHSLIPVIDGRLTGSIFRADEPDPHPPHFPAWPGPTTSDEQGRFTLGGLSRDLLCRLLIDDSRFAIPLTLIQTAEKIDGGIQARICPRSDRIRTRSEAVYAVTCNRPRQSSGA